MIIETLVLSAQLSAGAIVAHAKRVDSRIQDLSTTVHMEIVVGKETKQRVFELLLLRQGVNYRAVITLLEPVEMEGTRFLVVAERGKRNRQWAYFPDLDLVRSIAGRRQDDPFLGSDVSYADLAGGAHLDDLLHRLIGEEDVDGEPCYVIEGVPRHKIAYGKLRGWVRKDDYVTIRALFYDEQSEPLKEARLSQVEEVDGVPLARRIEMRSLVDDRHTVLQLEDVRINQGLSPDRFTEQGLPSSSGSRD